MRHLILFFAFFCTLFSVAAQVDNSGRLIQPGHENIYDYRGPYRPYGIQAPADSNYILISYGGYNRSGVFVPAEVGRPVWIHRDTLINKGWFDGIGGKGGGAGIIDSLPINSIAIDANGNTLTFGNLSTFQVRDNDGIGVDYNITAPTATSLPLEISRVDQVGETYIRMQNGRLQFKDSSAVVNLTDLATKDYVQGQIATDADTANVAFKFPSMLVRSDATDRLWEWTGIKWVAAGRSYTVATAAELSGLPQRTGWAYVSGEDAWYYWDGSAWVEFASVDEATVSQIAGDSAAVAEQNAKNYADGLAFSAGAFVTRDTTVNTDYTVGVANIFTITSFCDDGVDNTISLPTPVDSIKGNIIEVTHLDTSAAKARTTTVETDGTSYHLYDNFTGDTLTFFNIYQSGQTVRFTLQEIEGTLRWVAVNLSPLVLGDKELNAVGSIRQDNGGNLYTKTDVGEQKLQPQYTVSSPADIMGLNLRVGDRVKLASSGAEYVVQDTEVTGYATDTVAVVPTGINYAVLAVEKLKPEYFQGAPDFQRDTVSYTLGNDTISCTTCNFSPTDVGKITAVKLMRIDTAYSLRPVTMNAYITEYISSTQIRVDSIADQTSSGEMLWGTNNWTPLQRMFNYAEYADIREVQLDEGTYWANPIGVKVEKVISFFGLVQRGPIRIKGIGKKNTKLKIGIEDRQRINEVDILKINAIYMVGDGTRYYSDFTLESSDRQSTETGEAQYAAILQQQVNNIECNLYAENLDIISPKNYLEGWAQSIDSSLGGTWDSESDSAIVEVTYDFQNCTFTGARGVIGFFSQNGASKNLHIKDSEIIGGGYPNAGTVLSAANINAGSDTLVITDSLFSFYDLRTQSSTTDRKPNITLNGNTNLKVASLLSKDTAILETPSPSTFVNEDMYWQIGNDPIEGHGMYLHPNVSLVIDNVKHTKIRGYALKYFSSGGQQGTPRYFNINEYHPTKVDGSAGQIEFIPANWDNVPFAKNSPVYTNSTVSLPVLSGKIKAYNCNFPATFITDTSSIYNSTGNIRFVLGGADEYLVENGEYITITVDNFTGKYQFKNVTIGDLNVDGGELLINGGILSSLSLPPNSSNLISAKINNTIIKPNIGLVGTFISGITNNYIDLRDKIKFNNVKFSGKSLSNNLASSPFIPINEGINPIPIPSRINIAQPGVFCVNTDYQLLRYLNLPLDFSYHYISISNDSINQIEISEKVNSNIYVRHQASTSHLYGDIKLNTTGENFKLFTGGNLRLLTNAAREVNTTSSFTKTDDNVFVENTPDLRIESASRPSRTGINKEVVYNTNQNADTTGWQFNITITDVVGETHSLASATLPFEFDLTNGKPYLGFEESFYINPNTLLEITIPLLSGGNEVFLAGNYGELVGNNGGRGNIRLSDGRVKINTLGSSALDTLGNISVDYKYVSASGWSPIVKNSTAVDTLQTPSYANLFTQADTLTYTANDKEKIQAWQTQALSTHYSYASGDLTYTGNNEVTEIEYKVTVTGTDIFENFELAVYVGGVLVPALTDSYTFTATDTSHTFTGKAIVDVDNTDTIFFEGRFPGGNQTGEVIINRASVILERKKLR